MNCDSSTGSSAPDVSICLPPICDEESVLLVCLEPYNWQGDDFANAFSKSRLTEKSQSVGRICHMSKADAEKYIVNPLVTSNASRQLKGGAFSVVSEILGIHEAGVGQSFLVKEDPDYAVSPPFLAHAVIGFTDAALVARPNKKSLLEAAVNNLAAKFRKSFPLKQLEEICWGLR